MAPTPVRVDRHDTVAVITIDQPPVNPLSKPVREGLQDAIATLATDATVSAIVITGGPGRFIAGADLREMDHPLDSPFLPELVGALDAVNKPLVAALDGPALGGGLELALACDLRLGSARARLGLTETQLGVIPGAGGTQRLPRLIGIPAAIALITDGTILTAPAALALGLLDEIVAGDVLQQAIVLAPNVLKRRIADLPLPDADSAAIEAAATAAARRAKGVPAIAEAIRLVRAAGDHSFAAGCAAERAAFIALRDSDAARALRYLFHSERDAWRVRGIETAVARPIAQTAVIGAGTMGAAIAVTLADSGLSVLLVERDTAAAEAGIARIRSSYDRQISAGRLDATTTATRLDRITPTTDWAGLAAADLVIEAAFEDLAVKTDIFRRLDACARPGAVLASNTSYLDLDAIAAATTRPQDVIGLHFFAPADVMKLLEIVTAAATAAPVVATALALAKRLGKQPVIARVGDGFIGNRVYAVYRRHAEYLVEDGASPEQVDAALEAYGFAMGVFAVSDLSGLDIAFAQRQRRAATRDPGERYVTIADRLCEAGRLGRKTGAGWYAYDQTGQRHVDPAVTALIARARHDRGITPRRFSAVEIERRLLAVMANEGAKVLADGIAQRASDIDVVFVHGYGFPRRQGGPMWAADRRGLRDVLAEIRVAHMAAGTGSEPAPLLLERAAANETLTQSPGLMPRGRMP